TSKGHSAPRLHLDEGDQMPAPGDEVELDAAYAKAVRDDVPTLRLEKTDGLLFTGQPALMAGICPIRWIAVNAARHGVKVASEAPRARPIIRMHLEPRVDERADEPCPHGPLMIGSVTRTQVAEIALFVILMSGRQRAESHRREQPVPYRVQHGRPPLLVEYWIGQGDGQHLIGTAGRIVGPPFEPGVFDHVVQISALLEPEFLVERFPRARRCLT